MYVKTRTNKFHLNTQTKTLFTKSLDLHHSRARNLIFGHFSDKKKKSVVFLDL